MKIACSQCRATLSIPDEKIPLDRKASFSCPKCSQRNTIDPKSERGAKKGTSQPSSLSPLGDDLFDVLTSGSSMPDFLESDQPACLICESDPSIKKKLENTAIKMGYQPIEGVDIPDTLKKMRERVFDMVIVNERFEDADPDENGILIYLERLEMVVRRKMFAILVSDRSQTLDPMAQFFKSVDLTINLSQELDIVAVIKHRIAERKRFYATLKESFHDAGRPFTV